VRTSFASATSWRTSRAHLLVTRLTLYSIALIVSSCSTSKPEDSHTDSEEPAPTAPTETLNPPVVVSLGPQLKVRDGLYDPHDQPRDSPEWIDVDGDCQNTATEVLIARSTDELKFSNKRMCKVTTGAWDCFFTQKRMTSLKEIEVTPLVPFANAYASGASQWNETRQREFMNDPDSLIIVERGSALARGDYGPDVWLPIKATARCAYLTKWREIKNRWDLTATEAESIALTIAIGACQRGEVPELPGVLRYEVLPSSSQSECRIHCKSGKACGNSCIAAGKTCTKPAGNACDG
jgi:hypothetical protein